MKDALIFLGSGASVPFGLPTMKQFVFEFEKHLQQRQPHDSSDDTKDMIFLYEDIKNTLTQIHGYADLESVFSVIEILSRNVLYAELEFPSSYLISKLNTGRSKGRITSDDKQAVALGLLNIYKEFVRERLDFDEYPEERIDEVFADFYNTISEDHHDASIKTIQIEGKNYILPDYLVYTTNYDLIQEIYWQGITEINNLIESDDRGREILDLKRLDEDYSHRLNGRQLKYVKLHGSLNLYRLGDGTIAKLDRPRKKYGRSLVQEELMIYPIQQKNLYLYPWFDLFRQFKSDLDHTKNWIFIGYSFNDEFITNMILEILKKGNKKLIIVSPHASEIKEKKFSDHKESIVDICAKFGEKVTNEKILEALK